MNRITILIFVIPILGFLMLTRSIFHMLLHKLNKNIQYVINLNGVFLSQEKSLT
jgi:hypothetical protein